MGVKSQVREEERGQGAKRTAVSPLVSHQFCNTKAQESSRTNKKRCSYIHIKLSMYNCIQRRAPPTTFNKYIEFHLYVYNVSFVILTLVHID